MDRQRLSRLIRDLIFTFAAGGHIVPIPEIVRQVWDFYYQNPDIINNPRHLLFWFSQNALERVQEYIEDNRSRSPVKQQKKLTRNEVRSAQEEVESSRTPTRPNQMPQTRSA